MTQDIPQDKLLDIELLKLSPELKRLIAPGPGAHLYKRDFPHFKGRYISTILVIHSPGTGKSSADFVLKFCRIVAQKFDVSGLLFGIMEDRQLFDDRVRRSSHSSKTPLQAALDMIDEMKQWEPGADVNDIHKELTEITQNIMRASTEITEKLARPAEPREPEDLRSMVESLIKEMRPIARRIDVELVYQSPTEPVLVDVREHNMRIALRNLLDNAIKYSYLSKEVRLSLGMVDSRSAKLDICNYGIGIPEELLSEIREIGYRANVPDLKAEKAGRVRSGSGNGLPIAIEEIAAHGGTLHITSQPADSDPRLPYHRFVTTVTVTLPITKGGR